MLAAVEKFVSLFNCVNVVYLWSSSFIDISITLALKLSQVQPLKDGNVGHKKKKKI